MAVLMALEIGLKEMGWAVYQDGLLSDTGCLTCSKRNQTELDERVAVIFTKLDQLVDNWKPSEIVYKEPFRNQWPVPALDGLRSALEDWAEGHQMTVYLYTPREVRAGIVGKANAPKEDLAYAVMKRRGLVGVAKSTAEWEAVAAGDYHMMCRREGSLQT